MVDQLAQEYAGQPVVFLEYDVDNAPFSRYARWWAAYGGSSATLPLVMVDSGNQFGGGYVDFHTVYGNMVATALARPAQVELHAYWWRTGDQVRFNVHVTNPGPDPIAGATAHAIVYEQTHVRLTDRFVRAAVDIPMSELAPAATVTYTLTTPDLAGVDWSRLRFLALVDQRPPGTTGAYDTLQAAFAEASNAGTPLPKVYLPLIGR